MCSGLTKNQARAIEQYYIENGPNLENRINSISKTSIYYDDAREFAYNLSKKWGYRHEKNKWKAYKDKIGNSEMIVRVDLAFRNISFLHTYLVTYKYNDRNVLPSKDDLKKFMR